MNHPAFVPRRAALLLLTLLAIVLSPSLRPAADPAPKDHAIFVGLDVIVGWKGKYHRVIGVDKNAVRIMLDHKETVLPMALAKDIRIKQNIKLSNLNASVINLRGTEGLNRMLNTDELSQIHDSMAVQSMMEFQRDQAVSQAVQSETFVSTPDPNATEEAAPETPDPLTIATPGLDSRISQMAKTTSDRLTDSIGPGGDLDESGLVVSFEVSAPRPMEQCYAVVIASYTLPGDSSKAFNKISLHPLGTIGPSARKIVSDLQGFPTGAELKSYRVALYSAGLEIATNVSARRADVTRDEAVIFITTDYLAKHKGETLPPTPVLMVPHLAFASLLDPASRDQVIYARIGKDGRTIRLSTDAAGSVKPPSRLDPALDQLAFVPALEKGRPVEGVAKFKLADLAN